MDDKIFCGSGKEWEFGVNLNINLSDIPEEFITESADNKKWVRLNVVKKKTEGGKNSHYIEVDTWKPNKEEQQAPAQPAPAQQQAPAPPTAPAQQDNYEATDDNIPF